MPRKYVRRREYEPRPQDWPPEDTLVLIFGVAMGMTTREIAKALGRSRDSCLGRWYRIRQLNANVSQLGQSS